MCDVYIRTICARGQIVKALKREFPATRFRVQASSTGVRARTEGKDLIFVAWSDGPKVTEVFIEISGDNDPILRQDGLNRDDFPGRYGTTLASGVLVVVVGTQRRHQ